MHVRSNGAARSVVMHTAEKLSEVFVSFLLKSAIISAPVTIREIYAMNFATLPTNQSLSMEEFRIAITQSNPFFSGLLIPKNLLLEQNSVIILLEISLKINKSSRFHPFKSLLNTLDSSLNFMLPSPDIAKYLISQKISLMKYDIICIQ